MNLNDSFTHKPIKIAARCKMCKIHFCTRFIVILVLVSYFFYGLFLAVMILCTTVTVSCQCLFNNGHTNFFAEKIQAP